MVGETEASRLRDLENLTRLGTHLNERIEREPILLATGSIKTVSLKKPGKKILYQTGFNFWSASYVGEVGDLRL